MINAKFINTPRGGDWLVTYNDASIRVSARSYTQVQAIDLMRDKVGYAK